ncbi:MAG: NmrA family NAD(P)-binding protein [Nitrospirales bacterium]|nr:NmrA family NAD(P)-binding protein [Nitrospirales bacterium]
MFAVAGVTGQTGAVVATTLLERKQPVRVIVRTSEKGDAWKAKGAQVAVASLEDAQALANALKGATGAYLLVPPDYKATQYLEDRKRVVDAMASAVESSGLHHVVLLSSIGGYLTAETGPIRALHYAERRLGAVAHSMTIVRAPYFMENWVAVLGAARSQGVLPSFLSPSRKIPMIAVRDIGHIAAECLLDQPKGRRVLELSGPQDYSPEDVAAVMGQHLHRHVKVQPLPLSAVIPTFTAMGFSEDVATLFEEMYAGLENGRITYEGNGACRPRGLVTLSEAVSTWMSVPTERPPGDPRR